jgi:signal transduction histidine kinase
VPEPSGHHTGAAVQVAAVLMTAADLMSAGAGAEEYRAGLAAALRPVAGVRSVEVADPLAVAPGRARFLIPLQDRGQCLAVQLAGTGEARWDGHAQRHRLVSALTLLAKVSPAGAAAQADGVTVRELLRRLPWAAFLVDERGTVLLANDAFGELTGAGAGQWRGAAEDAALKAVAGRCHDQESGYRHLGSLLDRRRGTERLDLGEGAVLELERHPLVEAGTAMGALWVFGGHPDETAADGQNRLIATVSHEFRTPLTALVSFAELLAAPGLGELNADQRQAAEAVTRNAGRLLCLVDDLLLLSKLASRQLPMRFVEVDVPALVRSAVADRGPEAGGRGIAFDCETGTGPPVHADPVRLHQVLGNVLGNAVKYGAGEGRVRVSATYGAGRWTIEVTDAGMGIPAGDLDRIVRGFERGSNAVRAGIPGSGLGLAVTRELVELHGGTLEVASVLDVGTTVRIGLPVERRRRP